MNQKKNEKTTKFISPKSDLMFKRLFGKQKNAKLTILLMQSILNVQEKEYETISFINPENLADPLGQKSSVFDVKLELHSGTMVNLEMQREKVKNFNERILTYSSQMIAQQAEKGNEYDIKKTVNIIVIDFPFKKKDKYHYHYQVNEVTDGDALSQILDIHILVLPHLPEMRDGTVLYDILKFINTESEGELDMLPKNNEIINKSIVYVKELTADEKLRYDQQARERYRRDKNARESYVRDEGIEQGIEKEKESVAQKLLALNYTITEVTNITGFDEAKIAKLKVNL